MIIPSHKITVIVDSKFRSENATLQLEIDNNLQFGMPSDLTSC
jgi:hypothetical protein